jgi:hypothetical protein
LHSFPIARLSAKAIRVFRNSKADLPEAPTAESKQSVSCSRGRWKQTLWRSIPPATLRTNAVRRKGITWTEEEITQFEARHSIGSKTRLAPGN